MRDKGASHERYAVGKWLRCWTGVHGALSSKPGPAQTYSYMVGLTKCKWVVMT